MTTWTVEGRARDAPGPVTTVSTDLETYPTKLILTFAARHVITAVDFKNNHLALRAVLALVLSFPLIEFCIANLATLNLRMSCSAALNANVLATFTLSNIAFSLARDVVVAARFRAPA